VGGVAAPMIAANARASAARKGIFMVATRRDAPAKVPESAGLALAATSGEAGREWLSTA